VKGEKKMILELLIILLIGLVAINIFVSWLAYDIGNCVRDDIRRIEDNLYGGWQKRFDDPPEFEQINEDMHFVKELKEIIDESKKEQKQHRDVEYVQ